MSLARTRDGRLLEDQLRDEIRERQAEIKFVGELARVEYKPGDVLVLMADGPISWETSKRLEEYLRSRLGAEAKVLVLDSGMKIGLIGGLDASPRV